MTKSTSTNRNLPTGVSHVWRKIKACRVHRVPDDCPGKPIWIDERGPDGDRIPTGKYVVAVPIKDPATGKTRLVGHTHPTVTAARKEAESLRAARDAGRLAAPARKTFAEVAEEWLNQKRKSPKCRPSTVHGYETNVAKANAAFGRKPVQSVTMVDVEELLASEVEKGRTETTVKYLLRDVRAVLQRAVHADYTHKNVAAAVTAHGAPKTIREALPPESFTALRDHIVGHVNEAAWMLTLAGLRRSEVLGLRWSDVDLDAGTLSIVRTRVPVTRTGKRSPVTLVGATKTDRGKRTLTLTPGMVAAIRRTRTLRQQQYLAAGVPWDEEAYLCVNEDDRRGPLDPMLPDRYSRLWGRLCDEAGVPRVPLHSARHGSVTRMRDAGVLPHKIAAWHGHSEDVMALIYTHADNLDGVGEAAGL